MDFLSDTSAIWASVLKKLKEKHVVAYTAAADIKNIEFTSGEIILYIADETTHDVIKKNLDLIKKYAGGDYVTIVYKKDKSDHKKIEYLKSVLGDKLVIK